LNSGLAKDGVVIFGRFYAYSKIKQVQYEYHNDQLRMIFSYKNHDLYLFLKRSDEKMVKQFIIDFNK